MERERSELVLGGTLEQRVSNVDADLVLFYGGELEGNLGPCGCGQRPRGGLGRVASYVRASERRTDAHHLLFFDGYWLDDREEATENNRILLEAFEALGVDAANLTVHDLPALGDEIPPWAISANVEGVTPSRLFELDGHTLGVVAVGAPGSIAFVAGRRLYDPVEGALAAIEELDADVVVLMTWGMPEAVSGIVWRGDVDIVIDAARHQGFFAPVDIDEAVLVRAQYETTRLGELRIDWDRGVLVDRQINLDDGIPEDPQIRALREQAEGH